MQRGACSFATAAVVTMWGGGLTGASVGDSGVWQILGHGHEDLVNRLSLLLCAGCAGTATLLVPESPLRHLGDPAYGAVLFGAPVMAAILLARLAGPRCVRFEKGLLALLLVSMPLVYIDGCLRCGGGRWIWVELVGLLLFGGLALLGLRRSPWFLAIGVAAHGLLWDSWHRQRAVYLQGWYPALCLVVDMGLAAYTAAQVKRWSRRSSASA